MAWKRAVSKLTGKTEDFYELENEHAKSNYPQFIWNGKQHFYIECHEIGTYLTLTEDDLLTMQMNDLGLLTYLSDPK